MKHIVVIFCILLVSAFAIPVAASVGTVTTEPVIIDGVTVEPTLEPVPEPTKEPTTEPTSLPTRAPTELPTIVPVTTVVPQVGWVTIASTPSGASVTLDGRSVGVTPVAGLEVASGTSHPVRISLSGYEPYQTSVSVSPGEQAAVDGTLTPVVTPVPTTEPTKEPTVTVTPLQPIGGDKGWFRVHCNVDGAQAALDNGGAGTCTVAQGTCSIEVATTGTPVSTFTVTKSGYQTYTNTVSRMPSKGETVDLYATLNPIPVPTYGSIQVTSNPSGAVATLDGGSWQYTPCTFSSVIAGSSHTVQVSLSGYQPYTTTAYVAGGQTAYVSISLVPNRPYPNTGSLNVATSPKGADIYVDGRYVAQSPSVIPGLAPGSHSVRLHKAGYDEYVNTFTVYSGQQAQVSVTLNPQYSSVGSIEVSSVPAGSSLYLDGNYMGLTPSGDYFDLTSLIPGSHTVLLRHTNYQDYSQNVYVGGGKVVTVNAVLTPGVPGSTPYITGQIVAASVPAAAELFLDNVFKGITPLTLSDIPVGSHVVTMKEAGYSDNVQTVTVVGGQSTAVAATLTQPTPAPTATKSPMTVVPVVGAIVLVGAVLLLKRR